MKAHLPSLFPRRNRGSVLMVALILSIIIAISIASYLNVALNSFKVANRAFYLNAAENLVDLGLEQSVWSLNNKNWTAASGFVARAGFSGQYQGTFSNIGLAGRVRGDVKTWINTTYVNPTTGRTAPRVVSKATITLSSGNPSVKIAEAYLRPRSPFDSQFAVKGLIDLRGNNPKLDGWDSHSDTLSTGDDIRYFDNNQHTGTATASIKVSSLQTISIQNADIYGSASVGPDSSSITIGNQGHVGSYSTPNGGPLTNNPYVSYDFVADFPEITAPYTVATSASITTSISLPSGRAAQSTYTNEDGLLVYRYQVPSIALSGNAEMITIEPGYNVEITVTGDVSVSGNNGGIYLSDVPVAPATAKNPSTLTMYVAGDVNITGQGITNGSLDANGAPYGAPSNFTLYGTRSDTAGASNPQSFNIKGNGFLSAAIIAPNANVTINGNGDTYGGVVAKNATITGNGAFHGDTSLARKAFGNGWKVAKWRELTTAAERAGYANELNF